jgi:hypothetical protein
MPTPTFFEGWLQGALWAFGFATIAIGVALGFTHFTKDRRWAGGDA